MLVVGHSIAEAQITPTTNPPPQVWADQAYVNQTKYWFYRNRLINEFMKIGPNAGESTPLFNLVREDPAFEKYVLAYAGDGMIRSTGQYIGVLATEYAILKASGQDYTNTLIELLYALNAIKRLDETAETYNFCNSSSLSPPLPAQASCTATGPNWNGFLIRDDIDCAPGSAITKYFRNKLSNPFLNLETQLCYNLYNKKFTGGPSDVEGVTNNDMSHDQVNNLLIGMMLVKKFVDPNEAIYGINIRSFATQIITKILDHFGNGAVVSGNSCIGLVRSVISDECDSNPFLNFVCQAGSAGLLCGSSAVVQNGRYPWMIENPVTKQISCITIPGAGYGGFNSGGYAPTARILTGKNYPLTKDFSRVWDAYKIGSITGAYNVGVRHENYKILTQVALGNSWDLCLVAKPCSVKVCIIHLAIKCLLSINIPIPGANCGQCLFGKLYDTKRSLDKQSVLAHYEILPLLHNVLYNKTGYYESSLGGFHQDMINKAPCTGPYFHSQTNKAPYGWASLSILSQSDKGDNNEWFNGAGADDRNKFWGEYNGLDYMLMYNLQTIYTKNYNYYPNYMDNLSIKSRLITKGEYYNARSYKDQNGKIQNGNVVIENVVVLPVPNQAPAILDVRAGNSILIKSGFYAASSCYSHFYIHQPNENWNWEMTVCNSFNPSTKQPNGNKMASENYIVDSENYNYISENEELEEVLIPTSLDDNIPNPAIGKTTVSYYVSQAGTVDLVITDIFGKEVLKPIDNINHEIGSSTIEIDVSLLKPGVYIYTLKTNEFSSSKKMMINH